MLLFCFSFVIVLRLPLRFFNQLAGVGKAEVCNFIADNQLLIEKKVRDNRTFTEIHPLDLDGRVLVLARMISGDKVTDLSLANARELIEKSQGYG